MWPRALAVVGIAARKRLEPEVLARRDDGEVVLAEPNLVHRFYRWLGFFSKWDEELFNWKMQEPTETDWWVPGMIMTKTSIHFTFGDRVRILITGNVMVETFSRTDATISRAESRSQISVEP